MFLVEGESGQTLNGVVDSLLDCFNSFLARVDLQGMWLLLAKSKAILKGQKQHKHRETRRTRFSFVSSAMHRFLFASAKSARDIIALATTRRMGNVSTNNTTG